MSLKIFKVTNTKQYDSYSPQILDMVVVADGELEACITHPRGDDKYWSESNEEWDEPDNLKVELIGYATDEMRRGVVTYSRVH